MKKYSSKVKKSRRQTRLKTLRNRDDDEADIVQEASVKNARIKSAIEKGIESSLPSDTATGHCLKKFEHNGKEGPLVVYAEDRKVFNEYGNFTVITSFKPSDSLRNQLFFGERTSLPGIVGNTGYEIPQTTDVTYLQGNQRDNKTMHEKGSKDNSEVPARQRHQANSFEGLVARYKIRQEKYKSILGNDARYLFHKIDTLCGTNTSKKEMRKHDTVSNTKPVLPRITVDKNDDDAMSVKEGNTSDSIRHSRRKRENRLPHLTVSRYSTI